MEPKATLLTSAFEAGVNRGAEQERARIAGEIEKLKINPARACTKQDDGWNRALDAVAGRLPVPEDTEA